MGTVDVRNGQRFERRIGRRIEVDPVDVTFFVPQTGRFRKKAPPHEVPGRIENVSITGAAIVGPSTLPWQPGDRVVVRSRGADNVVVVRHRQATGAGHRFGVELTRSAATLKRQIQVLLEPHLTAPVVDEAPSGPVLGLKRPEGPRLAGLPQVHRPAPEPTETMLPDVPPPPPVVDLAPVGEAVSAPPPAPATVDPPASTPERGPVLDLTGPEPVLDLTDSVMIAPAPDLVAEPESSPEPVLADAPRPQAAEPESSPEPVLADAPRPEAAEPEPEVLEPGAIGREPVQPEAVEPGPVEAEAALAVEPEVEPEPEPVLAEAVEDPTAGDSGRVVAPRAPSPHLPHSPGRQVLDDVFGLMQD